MQRSSIFAFAKVLLGSALVAGIVAAPASAIKVERVSVGAGKYAISVNPPTTQGAQANNLTVTQQGSSVRFVDQDPVFGIKHPIVAVAPCTNAGEPNTATCPSSSVIVITAMLGDENDVFNASTLNIPVWVNGQGGTDRIFGSAGGGDIIGGGPNAEPTPLQPREFLSGVGTGPDQIKGGGGNDEIDGSFGDDLLNGGAGDDWIFARSGNDREIGGPGNDIFQAASVIPDSGNDIIVGGPGNDSVNSRDSQADQVRCNGGTDNYWPDFNLDVVSGCDVVKSPFS